MRDQRGTTMVELLVSISGTLIVMMAVVTLTTAVLHHQDRITRRVDANSRGRPVMTRMVQELHSACVTSHITPIRRDPAGVASTGTSINFLSKAGSAVGPIPDLYTVSLTGTTLRESVYRSTGGTAPNWAFSSTPTSNRVLLTNVTAPGGAVFRYFAYVNGALSTTPLPTPLTDANAALTSYVTISFNSLPSRGVSSQDLGSPLLISNGVDLRLENAGQFPNQDNLPCI